MVGGWSLFIFVCSVVFGSFFYLFFRFMVFGKVRWLLVSGRLVIYGYFFECWYFVFGFLFRFTLLGFYSVGSVEESGILKDGYFGIK